MHHVLRRLGSLRGKRLAAAAAVSVMLVSAVIVSAVALTQSSAHAATACVTPGAHGAPPGPTIAAPAGAGSKRMTMAAAMSAFGVSVPLPNTPAAQPADVGEIWEGSLGTQGKTAEIAVTFPAKGLILYYQRPVPFTDPTRAYQRAAAQMSSSRFLDLNGTTPALVIAENSDETCANFGSVTFVVNGTEVQVLGHTNEATLEALARSILAQ